MGDADRRNGAGRPVRVEDVARVAGVSPITVSRALSYPDKVKDETRARILEAVAQTGYVVNRFASSLRSGRSNVITVFVSSLLNPHFATSVQGIVDSVEGSGYHLMFAQTGYSEMLEIDVVESVLPFRPAGVVFTGVVRADKTRQALQKLGIPVMEMWGNRPDPIDMLVGSSSYDAGRLMGEHFGERGFRKVAYSGHTIERTAQRIEGFRHGLAKHGLTLELIHPMDGTRTFADGTRAFDAILEQLPGCDAIFFGTDVLAAGAMTRALDRGIAVPGQVAIAGYGDLEFTQHVRPSLTSLQVSSYEMGREAGRMLIKRLNGEAIANPIVLQPISIVARASTLG
ncbi:MAG TPA: LacI family DNA-binding transcriptional regulator [Devosia sp.]|uniref:LacI family DNA-binding transcriptional regulator n=1 Tax=Devosia sp. TaxID=1871048 RepID=UPI002DDCB57C|nr:LacI family DNA-binding transcriptional regulator [Devosia sp.]HEV2516265.1 LacI family DNA-binding transcriptional regulator [Devosia sp.]